MNFELKNIESFIPESSLESASELMQKDLVHATYGGYRKLAELLDANIFN